ncbi:hypothetical protein TI05_03535 [Achromatium sp. WMS3]|nr:hypothetical protein TI05_03535 [Achromatium sp. WMS3]
MKRLGATFILIFLLITTVNNKVYAFSIAQSKMHISITLVATCMVATQESKAAAVDVDCSKDHLPPNIVVSPAIKTNSLRMQTVTLHF